MAKEFNVPAYLELTEVIHDFQSGLTDPRYTKYVPYFEAQLKALEVLLTLTPIA